MSTDKLAELEAKYAETLALVRALRIVAAVFAVAWLWMMVLLLLGYR